MSGYNAVAEVYDSERDTGDEVPFVEALAGDELGGGEWLFLRGQLAE